MNQNQGIKAIAEAVAVKGGRAMLVGGFVRDQIMGKDPKDADIEVFNIDPVVLREVLEDLCKSSDGHVDCVGESFKVLKVSWGKGADRVEFDVSIPRSDVKVGDGHKGFEVVGNPNATFEEAARRRDFTFNAIMQDALTGEIIDPFNGKKDLEELNLRVVDVNHFAEDSLRVLRAVQFASRFNLRSMEGSSGQLMESINLSDLPKERVWGEFEKLLLKSPKPSIGFGWAFDLGVFKQIFPDLHIVLDPAPSEKAQQRRENFMEFLDNAADVCTNSPGTSDAEKLVVLLSAVARFLGDPETLLDSFGIFSKDGVDIRKEVCAIVAARREFPCMGDMRTSDFRRLSLKVNSWLFEAVLAAEMNDESSIFFEIMNALGIWHQPAQPFLQGRDLIALGMKPGKMMGDVLKAVFEKQLDGDITSKQQALDTAKTMSL